MNQISTTGQILFFHRKTLQKNLLKNQDKIPPKILVKRYYEIITEYYWSLDKLASIIFYYLQR
jgi:hypothetical protein